MLLKVISPYHPTGKCTRPTIESGTISPSSATIVVGESYTLTCDDGYSISGDPTMDCYDGGHLSTLPNCIASGGKFGRVDDDLVDQIGSIEQQL